MRSILIALAAIIMVGCTLPRNPTPPPVVITTRDVAFVEVPVCPAPPSIDRPELSIADIDATTSPSMIATAYAESIAQLNSFIEKQEKILQKYKELSKDTEKKRAAIEARNKAAAK